MSKLRWISLGLLAMLAPLSVYLLVVANGPDFDIEYSREIPSKLSVTYLGKVLGDIQSWPTWFHSAVQADQVDFSETPYPIADQKVVAGARIRLALDVHRPHGKSNLFLGVLQYVPAQRLSLRVLKDSKSSLTHLFEPLDWTLELTPVPGTQGKPESSLIKGTVKARTHSWRARVFGKIAAKALLNQVFYPDLFILAEINNPDVVYPDPDAQHGGM
jgi:hypothetical protein